MKQPRMRTNIMFDQWVNMIRKDERDFILGVLTDHKNQLVEKHNFQEAENVRDIIELVKAKTHIPLCAMNDEEGVPIKATWRELAYLRYSKYRVCRCNSDRRHQLG